MTKFIAADLFGVTLGNLTEFQVIAIFLIAIVAVLLLQLVIFGALLSRINRKSDSRKDSGNVVNNNYYYASPDAPRAAAPIIVPMAAPVAAPAVEEVKEQSAEEQTPTAAQETVEEEKAEEAQEEQPVEELTAVEETVEETQEAAEQLDEEQPDEEEVVEEEEQETVEEELDEDEEEENLAEDEEAEEVAEEPQEQEVEEEPVEEQLEEVAAEEVAEQEESVEEVVEETDENSEEPAEETVQEQPVEEEEEDEDDDDDDDEDEDEDEEEDDEDGDGVIQDGVEGEIAGEKVYRPRYTYPVKLKLSNDVVKGFYTELKNEFLSYGIKSRISKTKENFNFSRDNIARLCIRGKTMKLYIALDPTTLDRDYFHHRDASEKKTYAHIPTMVRIKSRKSVAKSKELIAALAEALELKKKRRFQPKDFSEDLSPVGLTYLEKKGYGYLMKGQEVTLESVELLPDELGARFTQKSEGRLMSRYIKTSVTLGELASRFSDGDTVNIDAIKASGIGSKNANYLMIEDGQSIDKKLKVYADEFSPNAVKMIAIAGGEVFKIERK